MDINSLECFVLLFGLGEKEKYTCLEIKKPENKLALLKIIQSELAEKEKQNVSQKI
jgi:hypothetical protein